MKYTYLPENNYLKQPHLPCPFCGSSKLSVTSDPCDELEVRCDECDANIQTGGLSEKDAVELWDTRVPTPREQELEAQNKALWELVEIGEQLRDMVESLEHYCGDSVDLVRAMRRKDTWDAAIQKAREAR
jgi:hypothetical protein